MPSATLTLTQKDLNDAVEKWLNERGIATTDRFSVRVTTTPGDRPFDNETTDVTVTGIWIGGGK